MRIGKNSTSDVQSVSSKQKIPVLDSIPTALETGDILFDQSKNLFYGKANNGPVSIGTRVIATITAGVNPAGIAITLDSKKAYVANNANYGDYTIVTPPQNINTVTVLDLEHFLPLKTLTDPSFNGAYTITMNHAGTKAYVTNSGGTTVTVISTATDTVIATISGFDGPSAMVITSDDTIGYVSNYGANSPLPSGSGTTVRKVDLINNIIIGSPIITSLAPAALAITSDNAYVYSANYVDGNPNTATVTKIQTSNNAVTTIGPFSPGLSGPFSIKLTPDNTKAVITNFGSNNFVPFGNTVSILNLLNSTIVNIPAGIQPSGLDITSDGKYAYFSNYNTLYAYVSNQLPNPQTVPPTTLPNFSFNNLTAGQGTVNIIDLSTNKIISPTIAVGQSPGNISISPNGSFALVSGYTSNTITVISV